ncbi:MAG: hypothetical protein UX58_C0004G0047 [Candidatus Wolfebacteria bacterium GW2011_GWB2_46_69]|nr:MAG: hypothetical protein UX58_C0004G0047 [Candidatus Wolfebacteria bacterium GW2011_GWB2_46_69]KKU54476.1 MAG: hypothetical protein UX76_C0002G0069 [Candidatus Wolfebacteria bacterium GW2011_GWC1_47_103]KKU59803.1 MAG: hypothetical protein UX83_C0002G0090 [Candidatus Wolfebacteria bacterium GW2011_GWE2_47_12]KKU73212.1 MAG: hypothetical protein UX96_C0007G0009 [Candidatus Wolfebacteria bacterium GW2011_GWB1_47_243]
MLSKKKIVLPTIAIVLLFILVGGVFNALMFVRKALQGTAGGGDGLQGGVVMFDLQKAKDLGIVIEE